MIEVRLFELRQAAGFAREARKALAAGDVSKAFRYHLLATRALYVVRGIAIGRGVDWGNKTARLNGFLVALGDRIEQAAKQRPVDPEDLIDLVADGLRVLRTRDGVDLSNAKILERSRNIVTSLMSKATFHALSEPTVHTVH